MKSHDLLGIKVGTLWTPAIYKTKAVEGGETEFELAMIGLVRLFIGETYGPVTLEPLRPIYIFWIGETYGPVTLEMTAGATFTVT